MDSTSGYHRLPHSDPLSALDVEDSEDIDSLLPVESMGDGGTKRDLQERHLSMIALAGMIGTGLFLSSGTALSHAGPLGSVIAFLVMGTVTASIAYTSAEMSAFKPLAGGFVRHTGMWFDQSASVAIGWIFWYAMAITMPTEVTAASTLLQYWAPDLDTSVPITLMLLSIAAMNFSPVRFYGEFEFFLAFGKIALVLLFILGGLILDLGVFPGQERLGFRFWSNPYPLFREYITTGFSGRFLGFWSAMLYATFAYGNVQVVAIAGAESRNPRRLIPMAMRKTFARIVFFYVASIIVISLTVPANDRRLDGGKDVTHSPFVIAFAKAGMKSLPSVINAVIFTSAFSSGNSCTFLASRTLHGLALDGHAPVVFLKLNRFQVPYMAVGASASWGIVAYMSISRGSHLVFEWLVALVTTSGIVSWIIIGWTYIRFFKALEIQGFSRDCLPYKSPFQPYLTYYALTVNSLVLLLSGLNSVVPQFRFSVFMSNYLSCVLFVTLYFICRRILRDAAIHPESIEFAQEFRVIQAESKRREVRAQAPLSIYDRVLNALF